MTMKKRGFKRFLYEQTIEQLETDIFKARHNRDVLALRPGAEKLLEFLEQRIVRLESELAELILLSDMEFDDE